MRVKYPAMGETYKSAATLALSLLAGLVLVTAFGADDGLGQAEAAAKGRPNIIFVLTDDQMPGTENRMPALQNNLVQRGLKFTNTVSTYPLCCPGRAVLQRGQYPHNTKIYGNSEPQGGWEKFQRLGLHKNTVATWLDEDYRTGLFGKYMNNYRDKVIPPGWDRWYAWNGVDQGWTSVNDQGNVKSLDRQKADALVADEAAAFLKRRLDNPEPVFAFVNFGAMHQPYPYPSIDEDKFRGVGVPRTPAFDEDDVSDKNAEIRRQDKLGAREVSDLDSQYRQGLRSLQRVDRFIADASDILRRSGEMDDTYFVFYTDNGAHFGQHRLGHGKLQPYEEDIGFPLIVRGPDVRRGELEAGLVGNHDIAPTIADMADVEAPAFVDGRSVMPLATTAATAWPRTAILSIREPDLDPPHRWDVLRMPYEKYIRFENGEKEYYDLRTDRHEVESDPGSISPATRAYWKERMDQIGACRGAECQAAEDAPTLPDQASP